MYEHKLFSHLTSSFLFKKILKRRCDADAREGTIDLYEMHRESYISRFGLLWLVGSVGHKVFGNFWQTKLCDNFRQHFLAGQGM
jgi:hypothetical protein